MEFNFENKSKKLSLYKVIYREIENLMRTELPEKKSQAKTIFLVDPKFKIININFMNQK